MSAFRYYKNPISESNPGPSNDLHHFPSLTFQDLINPEDAEMSTGNLGFVQLERLPEASMAAVPGPSTAPPSTPNTVVLTPGRSRVRTKTPGGSIKWRVLPQSPGDKDEEEVGESGEGSSLGQEEDKEYDPDPDSSSVSEIGKENASPTRSADFAKRLSLNLKGPNRRSRGERNAEAEVKYGRLQNPDKFKVIKARIKEMMGKYEAHKESVKRDMPSAKEVKAQGKFEVDDSFS